MTKTYKKAYVKCPKHKTKSRFISRKSCQNRWCDTSALL